MVELAATESDTSTATDFIEVASLGSSGMGAADPPSDGGNGFGDWLPPSTLPHPDPSIYGLDPEEVGATSSGSSGDTDEGMDATTLGDITASVGTIGSPLHGPVIMAAAPAPTTSSTRAGAQAAATRYLAAPPVCNLGDAVVGSRTTSEFLIYNVGPIEATVSMTLAGAPASVTLKDAPNRLRPAQDGITPPLRLVFAPLDEARISGTVVVRMAWPPGDIPPEEVRIPIQGLAHFPGAKTHAQRDAEAADKRQRAEQSVAEERGQGEIDRKVAARRKQAKLDDHEGSKETLERAGARYAEAIRTLYQQRLQGVYNAQTLLEGYEREQPEVKPSLIAELAWKALDTLTYGMASNVQALVSMALGQDGVDMTGSIRKPEAPFIGPIHEKPTKLNPALVTLVAAAFKQGIKKVGETAVGGLKSGPTTEPRNVGSARSSVAAFISAQISAFVGDFHDFSVLQGQKLLDALLVTTMRTDPEAAVRTMEAAASAVRVEASRAEAAQAQSTLQHWVQYVAQADVGSVKGPDGAPVIDMARINHTAGEHSVNGESRLMKFDGLVDIGFEVVNPGRPEEPVRAVSAEIRGVNNDVAEALVANGRLRPGIAVRAFGTSSRWNAVTPLTVVRDESGAISYTDHMGVEWEGASWLSQKAGQRLPSEVAQREGARILLDELLSAELPLVRRGSGRDAVENPGLKTDSKS